MSVSAADLQAALRSYEQANRKSKRTMERFRALGPGASSSRKGAWRTANANWSAAAEARDRAKQKLHDVMVQAIEEGIE